MYNELAELAKALEWNIKNCPNAPYVPVKREIVERLVQIDEGMRERVAKAMRYWTNGDFDTRGLVWVHGPDGYKKSFTDIEDAEEHVKFMNADAAIVEMKGGAK